MNDDLWRWADPDGQQRRVRLDELRAALSSGLIAPNTPVWRKGFAAWVSAHEVPELASSALGAANGVVLAIPPPPLAVVAVQHAYESLSGPRPSAVDSEEPPPPPPYVPAPVKASVPPPAPSSSKSLGSRSVPPPRESEPAPQPNIPTTIGLPPPPELLAAVAQAKAHAQMPPPPPVPTKRKAAEEELSSSSLIPLSEPKLGAPASSDLPPPTDPIVEAGVFPLGAPEPPQRGPLASLVGQIQAIRAGQKPKNPLLLPVLGLVGGATAIVVVAGVVSLVRGGGGAKDGAAAASSATAIASAASSTTKPTNEAAPATKAASAAVRNQVFGTCTMGGGPSKVIAPKAMVSVGVEAAALGTDLAVGFAPTPRDGAGALLAADTLAVTSTLRARPADAVKRVTPFLLSSGKAAVYADGERKGDKIASRRVVATSPALDVGVADGHLVWASHGAAGWAPIFDLEGSGPVEALRAVPLDGGKGVAVAFRRDGLLWTGVAVGDGMLEAKAPLAKITPKGQVGSPSIAVSGDALVIAWAERATPESPWSIRTARGPLGGAPGEAAAFELPAGGLGEWAMSPHVASLGGGKVLLSWTEGPSTGHQARAVVLDERSKPASAPLAISDEGLNAGQSQAAIGPDGRGIAVFLSAKGTKGYEVRATTLTCK